MNTEILVITDRSGSMSSIQSAAVNGFNSFIDEQRTVPGEARVTLVLFDHNYEVRYQAVPLPQVTRLISIRPDGWTALRDALGRTMDEQGARIAKEGWAHKVIVLVITDGQENRSIRYSASQIRSMVDHARGHGWEFVFLAANIDAFAAGAEYGFAREFTHSFAANAAGTQAGYASVSAATRALRGKTF